MESKDHASVVSTFKCVRGSPACNTEPKKKLRRFILCIARALPSACCGRKKQSLHLHSKFGVEEEAGLHRADGALLVSELVKSNDELKKALDVAYDKLSTMEEEIETLKESKKERETAGEAVDDVCSSQHMMQEDSPRRVASSSSSLLSTVRPFDHQGIVSVNKGKETGGIAQNAEIEGKNVSSVIASDCHELGERLSTISPSLDQRRQCVRIARARKLGDSGGRSVATDDAVVMPSRSMQDVPELLRSSPRFRRSEMRSSPRDREEETEEDRMMRLTIEASLRDFEEHQQHNSSHLSQPTASRQVLEEMKSQHSVAPALQLQSEETDGYNANPSSSLLSHQSPICQSLKTSLLYQTTIDEFDWIAASGVRLEERTPKSTKSDPAFGSAGQDLESNLEMMAFGIEVDADVELLGKGAFNAFTRTLCRESTKSATKAELDTRVQNQLSKAVSNDLIIKCNGVVKEGKEAAVYHANECEGSNGHDVAIKVFRRLRSFRALSERLNDATPREQLEIWAEKEYRNLIRARRAGVLVASPFVQKEKLVFMHFMGDDGWPSPQLKDLELRKGSTVWTLLYLQIMVAVRRLYVTARLVHGALSEETILVCPSQMVENKDGAPSAPNSSDEIQVVIIDLAQAVDVAHPSSNDMLSKDIEKIRRLFNKKGIKTLCHKMATEFVTAPDPAAEAAEQEQQDDEYKEALDAGAALAVAAVTQPVCAFIMNSCASSKSSHSKSSHSSGLARHPDRAMI